jgi:cell division initiation protein
VKLSPLDIQHQEFATALNGFNKAQVRDFLEQAAEALEALARENQALKDELVQRDALISELRAGESELRRAVVSAERLGNEMKERAQREAELILQEAKAERDALLREAEAELRELKAELARTEREHRLFSEQFRGMLRAYERSLDSVGRAPGVPVIREE